MAPSGLLVVVAALVAASASAGRPRSALIATVPFHRQVTEWACGDASFNMVMHHYGGDIDQRAIIDVGRTSAEEGTLSWDMVRLAHFSSMSAAPAGGLFPDQRPLAGWNAARPSGYIGFNFRTSQCWLEQLLDILGDGYPVPVLTYYALPARGGHYRVAIGYNDDTKVITLLDPWDRESTPHTVAYSYDTFCKLWEHKERNYNETYDPYYAAFIAPLRVAATMLDVSTSPPPPPGAVDSHAFARGGPCRASEPSCKPASAAVVADPTGGVYRAYVDARVVYPCPLPFCDPKAPASRRPFPLHNTTATLVLPAHMSLAPSQAATLELGTVAPAGGDAATMRWTVLVNDTVAKTNAEMSGAQVRVHVRGILSGHVPRTWKNQQDSYPAYSYDDLITADAIIVA